MGSAPGDPYCSAAMTTRLASDNRLDTALATTAMQNVMPARVAPTTYVPAERAREVIFLGAPKVVLERGLRPRALHVQRCSPNTTPAIKLTPPPLHSCTFESVALAETEENVGPGVFTISLRHYEFSDLPEGTYLTSAMHSDVRALCQLDATCRTIRVLNQSRLGPWHALGASTFNGIQLEKGEIFDVVDARDPVPPSVVKVQSGLGGIMTIPPQFNQLARVDWKGRFLHFHKKTPTFQSPFSGREINHVQNPDEVAYCCCGLRADLLCTGSHTGVYIEFEVTVNVDNLSLAVVDFEAGGHSSVTFSPDTGAVIRERKVREVPRKVEGAYIQALASTIEQRRFEGSIGLYIYDGHLAFFRRSSTHAEEQQAGPWESTGFVTDLSWAEGQCLTPCLAFRDEGTYHVKIFKVKSVPPLALGKTPKAYDETRWSTLDWEADAQEA